MKKLIQEVIELDKQAQTKISLLKKEKEELFLAIKEMRQTMTKAHKKSLEAEIKRIEEEAQARYEARLKDIEYKAANKTANIEKYYAEHKDAWLADLLEFISSSKEGDAS